MEQKRYYKTGWLKFLAIGSLVGWLLVSNFTLELVSFLRLPELATEYKINQAASAAGDVILLWDTANGAVPTGWTCVSCNPGEAFYGVFPRASSSYSSVAYGSDTHAHTTSNPLATQGADGTARGNTGAISATNNHTHTWPVPSVGAGDIRPPFKNLNFIYSSDPVTIPANVIGIFSTGILPAGWSRYAGLDGNYLRGSSDNLTGGAATHSHSIGAVTSGASGAAISDTGNGANGANNHTHTTNAAATLNANNAPPFLEVVFAYNSSGSDAALPDGLIAFFDANPPANWGVVSASAPWLGSFLKGAAIFGTAGGSSATHNHGGTVAVTSGIPSSATGNRGTTGSLVSALTTHNHAVSYTVSAEDSLPVYRDVILARFTPPAGPDATGYTSSEAALNYANCASTGCGGRTGQTITLAGISFGSAIANQATCSTGATNGCVRIGNYTVPAASITSWTNNQVILTIPNDITVFGGSGTTCGGANSGICVTQNGISDPALEFWVFPDITSISPSGAGEGREGEAVTLTGNRFDSSGGSVVFQNCGSGDIAASISSWDDTAVTLTVPAAIADNDDNCDLKLTRRASSGAKTDNSANFLVLPQILSAAALDTNAGRSYDAADTDGLVFLVGNHFGVAGAVTILGSTANQHATAESRCPSSGYSASGVCLEIPNDPGYNGFITLNRSADNKSHPSPFSFSILPRLTGFSPVSGSWDEAVTVQGNHFCQNGGICPTGFNPSNKVVFNSGVDATVFTSWSDNAIITAIPADSSSGGVTVTSNTYLSNSKNLIVSSPLPADPTALGQWQDAGLTRALTPGGDASTTPLYFTMVMSVGESGGTLYPQIEYKPNSMPFICGSGACGEAIEGAGRTGPGPVDCGQAGNACAIALSPLNDVYHWRARVRHNRLSVNYYSAWVDFPPADPDFNLDTAPPVISFLGGGGCPIITPNSNSATVSWTLDQAGTGQVIYSKISDLSGAGIFPQPAAPAAFSHNITLNNLDSGATYYFKVSSLDGTGNAASSPVSSPFCSFTTTNVTQPAKTVRFYIAGSTGPISAASPGSFVFSAPLPENGTSTLSAFIELTGIYDTSGGTPSVTVQANSQAAKSYDLPVAAAKSYFKIIYDATGVNILPTGNTLSVTPDANTSLYLASAQLFITYTYTP